MAVVTQISKVVTERRVRGKWEFLPISADLDRDGDLKLHYIDGEITAFAVIAKEDAEDFITGLALLMKGASK